MQRAGAEFLWKGGWGYRGFGGLHGRSQEAFSANAFSRTDTETQLISSPAIACALKVEMHSISLSLVVPPPPTNCATTSNLSPLDQRVVIRECFQAINCR